MKKGKGKNLSRGGGEKETLPTLKREKRQLKKNCSRKGNGEKEAEGKNSTAYPLKVGGV